MGGRLRMMCAASGDLAPRTERRQYIHPGGQIHFEPGSVNHIVIIQDGGMEGALNKKEPDEGRKVETFIEVKEVET